MSTAWVEFLQRETYLHLANQQFLTEMRPTSSSNCSRYSVGMLASGCFLVDGQVFGSLSR